MNIGNVGTTTYTTWMSRTNAAKTQENNSFENVADKKVMTCTVRGNNEVMLRSDALMSYASPQTGESVNIYRADNYSKENPMYIMKGLDANGNEFEKEVDASKINPDHCSYNELMVLNVETGQTSNSDWLHACAMRHKADVNSYFEEADWISNAQALMNDYQTVGSWDSYLAMSKWLQSIMHYVGKNDDAKPRSENDNITENSSEDTAENPDYAQAIRAKIEEIYEKITNGDTEQSFAIGAQSFTLEEWDEFLAKFDAVEEEIQKMQKEEIEKRTEKHKNTTEKLTTEEVSILTSESTMCTYPASNTDEENVRYITAYTKDGIFCRKVGETGGYEWTIPFENEGQYEKVMDFINQFPANYNFQFAAHENFWTDYLNGEIDEEAFLNFMEGTDNGIPNYATIRGDSVFVDTEKMKWAPYLNPLGAKFYTAEEFQRMQMELVEANAAKLPKITDSFEEQYKKAHQEYNGERIFRFENSSKLYNLDEIPILMYQKFLRESGYDTE